MSDETQTDHDTAIRQAHQRIRDLVPSHTDVTLSVSQAGCVHGELVTCDVHTSDLTAENDALRARLDAVWHVVIAFDALVANAVAHEGFLTGDAWNVQLALCDPHITDDERAVLRTDGVGEA